MLHVLPDIIIGNPQVSTYYSVRDGTVMDIISKDFKLEIDIHTRTNTHTHSHSQGQEAVRTTGQQEKSPATTVATRSEGNLSGKLETHWLPWIRLVRNG